MFPASVFVQSFQFMKRVERKKVFHPGGHIIIPVFSAEIYGKIGIHEFGNYLSACSAGRYRIIGIGTAYSQGLVGILPFRPGFHQGASFGAYCQTEASVLNIGGCDNSSVFTQKGGTYPEF